MKSRTASRLLLPPEERWRRRVRALTTRSPGAYVDVKPARAVNEADAGLNNPDPGAHAVVVLSGAPAVVAVIPPKIHNHIQTAEAPPVSPGRRLLRTGMDAARKCRHRSAACAA